MADKVRCDGCGKYIDATLMNYEDTHQVYCDDCTPAMTERETRKETAMPTDELKLPLNRGKMHYAEIGGHRHIVIEIGDSNKTGVAVCILPDEDVTPERLRFISDNADFIITAVNSHLDLTASVSELKYLLKKRRDDNADLVAENERMRACLSDIKELAANSAWGSDQDESLDTIREWAYQAITGDKEKGTD